MKRRKLLISISCALVAIGLIVTATYSWFHNYSITKLNATQIQVSSSSSFLISSSQDGVYSTSLVVDFDGLVLQDVTGNGVDSMYTPVLKYVANYTEHNIYYQNLYTATPDTTQTWSQAVSTNGSSVTANENADYISIDIYFKSSEYIDVYLGANSSIKANGSTLLSTAEAEADNLSAYGDFSKDCISGAMRVAVLDCADNDNPEFKYVWVPNSEYELNYTYANGWIMNLNGTAEDKIAYDAGYYYYDSNKQKQYFNIYTENTAGYVKELPSDGQYICRLTESTTEAGVYIGHIRLNIWEEGCDRESKRALAGGNLDIKLDFTSKQVVSNPSD